MSGQGSPNRSSLGTFLTRALNAFGRISAVGAAHGLYPSEEFRGMLERERSLADRHGRYFSLITFSREGIEGWANDGKVVARILTSRLRTTDVAGWMEGRRIGVILRQSRFCGRGHILLDLHVSR